LKNGTEDDLGVEPLSMVAIVPFDHKQPNTTGFVECRARVPEDVPVEDLDWDIEAVAECCLDRADSHNEFEDEWWVDGSRGPGGARAGGDNVAGRAGSANRNAPPVRDTPASDPPQWQPPDSGPIDDPTRGPPDWRPSVPPQDGTSDWRPSGPPRGDNPSGPRQNNGPDGNNPEGNNPDWRPSGPQRNDNNNPDRSRPGSNGGSDWRPSTPPNDGGSDRQPASPPGDGSSDWRPSSPPSLPRVPSPPSAGGATPPSPSLTIINNPPGPTAFGMPPSEGLEPGEEEIEFDPGANGFGGAWSIPSGTGGQQPQQAQQPLGGMPGWQSQPVPSASDSGTWQARTQNAAAGSAAAGSAVASSSSGQGPAGEAKEGQAASVVATPQAENPSWLQQQAPAGPASTTPPSGSIAKGGADGEYIAVRVPGRVLCFSPLFGWQGCHLAGCQPQSDVRFATVLKQSSMCLAFKRLTHLCSHSCPHRRRHLYCSST
jgi:hypothetical protein